MNIRYGTPSDATLLSELGAKTFFDTFAKDNTPQDMADHLKSAFSPEIQLTELADRQNIFLIVEAEHIPIGYAQLIADSSDKSLRGLKPLEIRRIYAVQEYQGKGVGKLLMSTTIREARQRGHDCIWLGVWEKNPKAIAFYEKWGFQTTGSHVFHVGSDPQTDHIMELLLP